MRGRIDLGAVAIAAALSLTATLARGDEPPRVAVLGAGADGEAVASALASRLTSPADSDAFRGALGAGPLRTLALATKRHDKDLELVAHVRGAARSSHADKAIVVHVDRSRTRTVVHVWLVDAEGSGPATIDQDVRLGASASAGDEADAAWNVVASAVAPPPEASAPAPAAEPAPAAPVAAVAGPSSQTPPDADTGPVGAAPARAHEHTRAGSMAVLGAALQGGTRHVAYVDRLTPTLRPYDLFVAPLVAIEGEIYPFVGSALPVLGGLGAVGSYARAFGLSSQDSDGTSVSTSWQAFALGLRERLPIGTAFVLGIDAGYGDTSFEFDDPIRADAQLPSAHYKFLRGGVDGRLVKGDLSAHAAAGYLDVLSTGDMAVLFPRESVGGVQAALGIADQVAPAVEVSLDLDYTRFFYSLLPQPGDTYVAGGVLDEMATISLGVAYLF